MTETNKEMKDNIHSAEDILKSDKDVEHKFGLLVGLIKENQVSNKDVVNTVLHLLVGGEFDIESNFVIQDAQNILHMLHLLMSCEQTLQAEIWSLFTAMLKKSRRNLQACTEVGLISHTLNMLRDADDVIADLLVDMLGTLAGYSITVKELKNLFGFLKTKDGKWPQHAVKLLTVLQQMPQRHGPDEFFSFPGKKGSYIALPPVKTWPYQNGWTFSCWLRLDPVTGVTVERERPYLYCFKTSKGVGYSGNYVGNTLVLTSMKVKGKGFQHCVKYEFQPRKWYMVTVVHVYNRWSKSELRCYVDGQLASTTDMSWLVSTSDPFDKCFIGGSVEQDADFMFCGQLSTVYMFSEALLPQQIDTIYHLGPGYKSQFRFENESITSLAETSHKMIYDGHLTSIIMFMYNPIACDSQLCLESSPKGNPSYFVHTPHALMSQDVKAVITHSIHSTLHSLGGVQVLFPLFAQLDTPVEKGSDSSTVDHTICANLMSLICELIKSSVTIQQQMMQNKGFQVIGYLLEKSNPEHITPAVLESFLELTNYLVNLPTGSTLLKHLFDHILFNPALWIYTSVEVQTKLYCYLATEFINNAQIYNSIRRVSAVLQTLHTLKYYYWVTNPKDRSGVTPSGVDGNRPTHDEIVQLRSFMLLYVKQLLLKDQGVQEDELQSILNYLCTLHEDDNLMDVLQLLVSLMAEHPSSMVPAFDNRTGIRTVFKLLASSEEELRIQALKLMGFFLMRSTHKRKQDAMSPQNLFSLIGERLMLNEQHITMATYNVLFENLTERISVENLKGKHPEPESYFRIENSAILKVVATMIRQSKPLAEVMDVKKMFLSDLTILCNNNKENRRTVLQMSVWQDWLFSMAYIYPRNQEEQKITDMVMSLFKMLLHHAIKFEYGGWRVWIDTLAIVHSKVAYEDFKIHMSKMYQQYERQRVDDIADPHERQQHPISTISGISDAQLQKPIPKSTVKIEEIKEQAEVSNGGSEAKKVETSHNSLPVGEVTDSGHDEKSEENDKDVSNADDDESSQSDTELKLFTVISQVLDKIIDDVVKEVDLKSDMAGGDNVSNTSGSKPEKPVIVTDINNVTPRPRNTSQSEAQNKTQLRTLSVRSHADTDRSAGGQGRHIFSPGPRAPPFRIPEFRWSMLHQKLLSDLLFAVETDIQVWKSHSTKSVIDFVNAGDNHVYVMNVTHMISQLADNLITSCGGLLPLLAAATSPNGEVEILEPNQGLSIEQAVSILQRVIHMTDILVFASSTNFAELEQEKNMPSGGILRQCLRLVCTSAVRNCLECRHRYQPRTPTSIHSQSEFSFKDGAKPRNGIDPLQSLIVGVHPTSKNIVENLGDQTSPIKDPEKLLQDMDINRLRAVVYRDMEETKQAQFLALAIVYFSSVLMVSKYRDILEPLSPAVTPVSGPHRTSLYSPSAAAFWQNIKPSMPLLADTTANFEQQKNSILGTTRTENGDVHSKSQSSIMMSEQNVAGVVHAVEDGGSILACMASGSSENISTIATPDVPQSTEDTNQTEQEVEVNGEMEPGIDEEDEVTGDKDKDQEETEENMKKEMEERPEPPGSEHSQAETEEEDVKGEADGGAEQDTQADGVKNISDSENTESNDLENAVEDESSEATAQDAEPDPEEEEVGEETGESVVSDADAEETVETKGPEQEGTVNTTDTVEPDTSQSDEPVATSSTDATESSSQIVVENEVQEKTEDNELKTDDRLPENDLRREDDPPEGRNLAISSITISTSSASAGGIANAVKPEKLELEQTKIPAPLENLPHPVEGGSLTERLERALGCVAPLLREIFVDFAPFLSKTLIGSHGQELLIGGLVTLKQSTSVVELVMLLCSQEWQNSLQKHAGLAFIELVNEGRLLAHATRDHIVRVANEAEFILNRMRADDVQKHAEFESLCAQMMLDRKEEEKLCDHLITSAKRRDHTMAAKLRDKIVNILTNKHGAWGEAVEIKQDFWKLDLWEDDSRRRRRMIKNALGSTHPEATIKAVIEHGATEDAINQAQEAFHSHLASKRVQQTVPDYTDEELLMEERDFDQEFAGPVALSTLCKLIAPGVAVKGTMSITKNELYFEIDEDDEENKNTDANVLSYVECLHGKWNFNEIRAVFSRQYLLQNVAIELFMANRTAVMFSFPDHVTVKKVVNALPRVGVGVKYGLPQARRDYFTATIRRSCLQMEQFAFKKFQQILAASDGRMSLASGKQLFKLSTMMQKWQRREISNFDYLMYLNTIADRTYNDLNQYPVFPWVIVNYESDELDLSQPSNFRDLSKPIGALNPTRREFFDERYNSWEHEQIPPFHYGTHYSTAAFTLDWLIRVEPFTSMFLNLQGGKFDHANQTFFSVTQSWKNCQRDTSDVKELIPEFFYLPEMFVNRNGFNFGKQEEGLEVKDVIMPTWAKNPEDFVRINRMALESEFVSCQLHHWIDLIFGYKQRGPEAVRATNVFYYLTYDGSVVLENMNDPVMKEAIENQIRSFGQTPSQLLTEPHPPRSSVMHLTPMMFTTVQDDVCMIMKFLSNSPVTHVAANTHPAVPGPAVTTITCNHNFAINKWNATYQQGATPTSFSSDKKEEVPTLPLAMDQLLVLNTGLHRRTLGDNFDQRLKVTQSSFVTTADNRFIFASGFWDKSFRLFSADTAKILQVIYGHFDVVTCMTRSENNLNQDCYIITGSKDCTVMVWMFTSRNQAIIGDNGSLEHPTPKATLTGHETEVTCVSVLAELGLVISGSKGGPCLVHTLNGDLLTSLEPPEGCCSPELITMSREAFVLVKFEHGHICNYSVSGNLLKHVTHKDTIQTMILSRDGQYMMIGGDGGVVEVWRSHDLTLLYTYPTCDSSIRALSLTHDHKFLLSGLATGCLLVFNIDFNKWHHEYQERY